MDPFIPALTPSVRVLMESAVRCPVNPEPSTAAEPSSAAPSVVEDGPYPSVVVCGASCAVSRRRRIQDDPVEHTPSATTDMIARFQTIIRIVGSRSTLTRPRPEIGDLLKAIQCLKLPTWQRVHPQKKRCRRQPVTPEVSAAADKRPSVALLQLQETIAAIEQMRLSEPVENTEEYAEVLGKLQELLRTQELEDG